MSSIPISQPSTCSDIHNHAESASLAQKTSVPILQPGTSTESSIQTTVRTVQTTSITADNPYIVVSD